MLATNNEGQEKESDDMDPATNEVLNLWSRLFPVRGYTSGFSDDLSILFKPTPENLQYAYAEIEKTRSDIKGKLPTPDLQFCADRLLVQFKSLLRFSGPAFAATEAGDGIFYIIIKEIKENKKPDWLDAFLQQCIELFICEAKRWSGQAFSYEIKRGCLDAAGYFKGCLDALNGKWPLDPNLYQNVMDSVNAYWKVFYVVGLDTDNIDKLLEMFSQHEGTPAPVPGYPALLSDQFNLGVSAQDIESMAMDLMNQEMPLLKSLAKKMAEYLGIPLDSTIEQVWEAQSNYYAVRGEVDMAKKLKCVCDAYANEAIIRIDPSDNVSLVQTPSYLEAMVTGGEDRAVDYLTDHPTAALYYTPSKNSSLLTMINIIVHELSHGYNFVKAAQHAGSPLLNLFTPILEVLTEGMAFFREYQYSEAINDLLHKQDLTQAEKAYLELYGDTREAQQMASDGATFETYIWRIIRYIRALCDVKVNGGEMTYTAFLDWASELSQISKAFLHGECFTFLSQPGYAPCYTVGGKAYQYYQEEGLNNNVPELTFNTKASDIGFLPWTRGIRQLAEIAQGKLERGVEHG